MKKKGVLLVIILILLPAISAYSVDEGIQKVTHYAEEYEIGNINYVQLLVYLSSVREKLNEELGATEKEYGGILKQEQIRAVLGESDEETKWVWVENEGHEKKIDEYVPIWKKIVFDGKKIQIRLSAYPSIFMKKDGEEKLIYRLHFQVEFKKPEEELDIKSKVNEIQELAEIFNSNPSSSNAEALAKASVNAERAFESYLQQNQGKCEDLMKAVFGSENFRGTMGNIVYEIEFYEGDNFVAIIRLEMCDDCDWNWVNLHMWLEGRGRFRPPKIEEFGIESRERYKGWSSESYKHEAAKILDEIKMYLEQGDYEAALSYSHRLQMLTEAWNEEANNVWEQVNEEYGEREDMTEEERIGLKKTIAKREESDPYYWIKREQEKRRRVKELQLLNYEDRKNFFLMLFESYDKKEFYFESVEYEKRLVEEFKDFGQEICDNNQDDNDNGQVDCDDSQCAGKFCGKEIIRTTEGNEIKDIERNLYCITGICQEKEEEEPEKNVSICGNHICEVNETIENCAEDCSICPEHPAINCSGKVIFSGEDENGCPLEPICLEEDETCETNEDCPQPLCGVAECIENICQTTELIECNQTQCVDGEKIIEKCDNGDELVTAICEDSMWVDLFVECEPTSKKVCCQTPGPADEPTYEWKPEEECQHPEDALWPNVIVDDSYCKEEPCVEAGGQTGVKGPECCDGLKRVSDCLPNQPCPISLRYCVDCGNDVCEEHENWHNCPGDCKEKEMTCEEECKDFMTVSEPTCIGAELKISGTYPDCKCEWDCEEIKVECKLRNDCGGENDVCSNGKCVTIPEIIPVEPVEVEEEEEIEEEKGAEEETQEETEEEEEEIEPEEEVEEPEETEENSPEESEPEETPTGGVIFNFFRTIIGRITGAGIIGSVVNGEDSEETPPKESPPEEPPEEPPKKDCPDAGSPPDLEGNCWYKETYDSEGCVSGYDVECGEWEEGDGGKEDKGDWEEEDRRERERHEEEQRERCKMECNRPCVEKCIREACGEELDCNIDEERKSCEGSCEPGDDCIKKCMSGEEDWWKEFQDEEKHKEEKGVFSAGGGCRTAQGETKGFIWFNGWGDPFDDVQPLKQKYYSGGEADWCKWDLENLKKQRREFEEGFNQEFAVWFFEKYLANSAEDWEQHVSGIFEMYWRDVDISREIVMRMKCLGIDELPEHNLINIEYESEYGSLKFWEEVKTVKMDEMEGEEVTIISPYMEIWIFPPKEFIIYEMKESMKNHEFPGPSEEKIERENQGGPTEEEKEEIREDEKFMKKIRELSEKYGGSADIVIQFVNYETNEVVFNLYAQVNEEDIMRVEPMLPEEVPEQDIKIEMDFEILYDIIYTSEKEMRGIQTEYPPWDRQGLRPIQKIKEITSGAKMYLKVRSLMNSAEVTPKEAEKDVESIFKEFIMGMMSGGGPGGPPEEEKDKGEEKGVWESKEKITGEIIG